MLNNIKQIAWVKWELVLNFIPVVMKFQRPLSQKGNLSQILWVLRHFHKAVVFENYTPGSIKREESQMSQEITATIIIKSPDEYVSSRGEIDAQQALLGDYLPDLQTIVDTARYFRDAGFQVRPKQNCINIAGSIPQFEAMFGVQPVHSARMQGRGYERVPERLQDILVRIIFPGMWSEAY